MDYICSIFQLLEIIKYKALQLVIVVLYLLYFKDFTSLRASIKSRWLIL